jgi:general secretion pathway protein B
MSYILDALKKSDQQRQRGATPTLQTAQSTESPRQTRRALLYPTLALALAAIAFALGSLRPWRTEAVLVVDPRAPVVAAPAAIPAVPPAVESSPQTPPAAPNAAATQTPAAKEPARIASVEPPSRAMRARPPAQGAHAPELPSDAPAAEKAAAPPASAAVKDGKTLDDKVVALADLPASLRAELPPMNITVHAYSRTPKDRLVGVNDKLLREGDTLTPDLVLERITPDGMIFSYKGSRFQRGVR